MTTRGWIAGAAKSRLSFPICKDWRPIATRYDRCAHIFCSAILLPATGLFQ